MNRETEADLALGAYEYELPPERIASRPPAERDGGRLMLLPRAGGPPGDRLVTDLPELLRAGDVLVLNDSRVVRARLLGSRAATGGRWEGLFLALDDAGRWRLMAKTKGKPVPGEIIEITPPESERGRLGLTLVSREPDGVWVAVPAVEGDVYELLEAYGRVPLPPYIRGGVAEADDGERYQTVYAGEPGSVAAPTAGLHLTDRLLDRCRDRGATITRVTLHVGAGTFKPIAAERIDEHAMHAESFTLSDASVDAIEAAKAAGGRIVAVGTTATRVLESAFDAGTGRLRPVRDGVTRLYLRPGRGPRFVDGLLTNFHLPKSSLIVLVSAFAGRERVLAAYREAVSRGYRFYSYGDAMLIV